MADHVATMLRYLGVGLLVLGHVAVGAGQTLDDFIGFPIRDYLVGSSASGHDKLAWVEKQRGVVNLYIADERSAWVPKQLINYSEDEGVDSFVFLQFTADGSALVFVMGTSAETNPRHRTTPPVSRTFAVNLADGSVKSFSGAKATSLSKDGQSFFFVAAGGSPGASTSVWRQPLEGEGAPMRSFSVKQGSIGDLVWNPKDDVLSFSNDRGDHGFVGLYSPVSSELVWVAASIDTDMQPAWSPDGRSLSWVRAIVPAGNVGYSPFDGNMGNRGPDFAIMVADVSLDSRGKPSVANVREVFRDVKYGMLNFGYGQRPLLWVNSTTVLFGTEALSSWAHVVMLDVTSGKGQARELRSGSCEDISWLLGEDGWLYVVNNCADIDEVGVDRFHAGDLSRHEALLSSSQAQGGVPVAGLSSNGYGIAPLTRHVALLGATYNAPTGVLVMKSGTNLFQRITEDRGWSGDGFVRPRLIEFQSSDGAFTLHAQLFLPNASALGSSDDGMSGIVYTHGGSERQMYGAFHYADCYAQEYAANQWLASQGKAVLSVNYRSGVGYGHDFRVCKNCMSVGAAEYQDVREAAVQLGRVNGVDPERIGIWGLSYGGLNAEQACARDSKLFKACVAISGIFNWVSALRYSTDTGLSVYDVDIEPVLPGGFRSLALGPEPAWAGPEWAARVKKLQALILESSPAGHVQNLTSPMLLIHGDSDEEVAFQETLGAVRAVRALGRENVQAKVYPDEAHGLALYAHQLESLQDMGDFLASHLTAGPHRRELFV